MAGLQLYYSVAKTKTTELNIEVVVVVTIFVVHFGGLMV
jgi:hypothetical protein